VRTFERAIVGTRLTADQPASFLSSPILLIADELCANVCLLPCRIRAWIRLWQEQGFSNRRKDRLFHIALGAGG